MFTREWMEEHLDPATRQNLVQAFASIGRSGIIEAHTEILLAQATDGYWDQPEEELTKKIRETRIKLAMMRSLAGFCTYIEKELGVEQ